MAGDVKLNLAGLNVVMTSPAVQAEVDRIGARMAAAAGEGFEYVARPHRYTARGYVQATSDRARRRQMRDAVLEQALGQVQR